MHDHLKKYRIHTLAEIQDTVGQADDEIRSEMLNKLFKNKRVNLCISENEIILDSITLLHQKTCLFLTVNTICFHSI